MCDVNELANIPTHKLEEAARYLHLALGCVDQCSLYPRPYTELEMSLIQSVHITTDELIRRAMDANKDHYDDLAKRMKEHYDERVSFYKSIQND